MVIDPYRPSGSTEVSLALNRAKASAANGAAVAADDVVAAEIVVGAHEDPRLLGEARHRGTGEEVAPARQVAVHGLGVGRAVQVAEVAEMDHEVRVDVGGRAERAAGRGHVVRVRARPEHEAELRRKLLDSEGSRLVAAARASSVRNQGNRVSPDGDVVDPGFEGDAEGGVWLPIETRFLVRPTSALRPVPTSVSRVPSNAHSSTRPSASTPSWSCTQASFGTGTSTFTELDVMACPVTHSSRSDASLEAVVDPRELDARAVGTRGRAARSSVAPNTPPPGRMSWFL